MRDRLRAYIRDKGITEYSFCKQAGLALNFMQWETSGVSAKSMHKIGQAFPDLNLHWVATGQGDMIKGRGDTIPLSVHLAIVGDKEVLISSLYTKIHELESKLEALK